MLEAGMTADKVPDKKGRRRKMDARTQQKE